MTTQQTWIIDFDETLASGNITWALQSVFPSFIARHQLPVDRERLASKILELQEVASRNPNPVPLLAALFETMGWPSELQSQLLEELFAHDKPELFDDALLFLERLRSAGHRVLIVSNNPRTLNQVPLLGLESQIDGVFTPHNTPGTLPKPDRSMWDYIIRQNLDIDPENTIVVGDDPWSEGSFAATCGLHCWIVDRMDRFSKLSDTPTYLRVRSLLEIPV